MAANRYDPCFLKVFGPQNLADVGGFLLMYGTAQISEMPLLVRYDQQMVLTGRVACEVHIAI